MKAITHLSIVPIRSEPSDRSEMVSQFLFGESLEVLETKNQWRRVRSVYDNYEGWIDQKQMVMVDDRSAKKPGESATILTLDLVQLIIEKENRYLAI